MLYNCSRRRWWLCEPKAFPGASVACQRVSTVRSSQPSVRHRSCSGSQPSSCLSVVVNQSSSLTSLAPLLLGLSSERFFTPGSSAWSSTSRPLRERRCVPSIGAVIHRARRVCVFRGIRKMLYQSWPSMTANQCYTGPPSPSASSERSWLVETWDCCRTVTKRTPTRAFPSTVARIYNEDISLKVAQRAKVTLLNAGLRKHRYAFQLLPVLKREIDAEDEDTRLHPAIDREIDIFRKHFSCLGASRSLGILARSLA